MARYDVSPKWFRTPRDHSVLVYIREGTNDWNTANSCLTEDEYGTKDLPYLSNVCLDIGGYLGTVSLALLIDHPEARVVIVEPIPENAELIRQNLRVNAVAHRATVIEGAVGKSGEPVTIRYAYAETENDLHHAFVGNANTVPADARAHREVTYPALGLADLTKEPIAWLKIDCEGGEWGFLDDPLIAQVERIVGEFHPVLLPDGETGSRARLEQLLGATHEITYAGPEAWGFTAVRRAPIG